MNILFLRKTDFLEYVKIENEKFSNKKRNEDFYIGRFLIKYGAKIFYNINDFEIIYDNKKPYVKNNLFYFNISHSKDIVAAAFDNTDIGLDIEFMKNRNWQNIAKYLKVKVNSMQEFYQYWTIYEAQYKSIKQNLKSFIINNYMISLSFQDEINNKLKIYELVIPKDKIIPDKLINLQLINANNKNENPLKINEISISSDNFLPTLTLNIK